ncbi:MAG: Lrp/AsnC family transcriptional regulator [Candidatus Latescibacterota bacterium]|jgi:Lrp/AsnC family leucine-responsive transcriptional regulator|nr:MAG: Lrp/AsnC family transcriptional regulator [Candidatus Latescibacterota bacterium]
MYDKIDAAIMEALQGDARTSNADIARRLGMAPSAIHERIRKLEQRGCIRGYEAKLDPVSAGFGLLVFLFVRTNEKVGAIEAARLIARIPEVLEVHHVAGDDCYLVKLRVRDTAHLSRVMREELGEIESITSTRTTIVLETIRETSALPLGSERETAPGRRRGA